MTPEEIDTLIADKIAIKAALRALVKFIDPAGRSVLMLNPEQTRDFTLILKEAYRCLWFTHPGLPLAMPPDVKT